MTTQPFDRERELRQLRLMGAKLGSFQRGDVGIGAVIADLEGLVWQLQSVDQAWLDQFFEGWGLMEIAYAVALDRVGLLPTIADFDVAEGVELLLGLVSDRIAELT